MTDITANQEESKQRPPTYEQGFADGLNFVVQVVGHRLGNNANRKVVAELKRIMEASARANAEREAAVEPAL